MNFCYNLPSLNSSRSIRPLYEDTLSGSNSQPTNQPTFSPQRNVCVNHTISLLFINTDVNYQLCVFYINRVICKSLRRTSRFIFLSCVYEFSECICTCQGVSNNFILIIIMVKTFFLFIRFLNSPTDVKDKYFRRTFAVKSSSQQFGE